MRTTKIIDKISQKPLYKTKEYNNFADAIAEAEFIVKQLELQNIKAKIKRTGDGEYTVIGVDENV